MTLTSDDYLLLLRTLGGIALVYVFLRWYEPRMIFLPHIPSRRLDTTPASLGLGFEDLALTASDDVHTHAWYIPNAASTTAPVILFFHGNAGNIGHRLEKMKLLRSLGAGVLLLEYRGYGESWGRPSEQGFYRDARAAYDFLTVERGIAPSRIVVYGESLGTGVAVDLAVKVPVGGLILEAAFTSIPAVAQGVFPFLPGIGWVVRNRFDSKRKIGRLKAPLLMLHSRNDAVFSLRRHGRRLFAAAPEPKQLLELRGNHNEAVYVCGEQVRDALATFLATISLLSVTS